MAKWYRWDPNRWDWNLTIRRYSPNASEPASQRSRSWRWESGNRSRFLHLAALCGAEWPSAWPSYGCFLPRSYCWPCITCSKWGELWIASSTSTRPRQRCRNRCRWRCSKPDGPNETTSYFATLPTLKQTALQSRRREKRSLRFKIWRHLSSSTLKKLWMNWIYINSVLRRRFQFCEHQAEHPLTAFRRLSAPMKRIWTDYSRRPDLGSVHNLLTSCAAAWILLTIKYRRQSKSRTRNCDRPRWILRTRATRSCGGLRSWNPAAGNASKRIIERRATSSTRPSGHSVLFRCLPFC